MRQRHRNREIAAYSFGDAWMQTFFWSVLTSLCFFASMQMLRDVFPKWVISREASIWICALAVVTAALYEIGIRALPRFHALCVLVLAGIYGFVLYRYAAPRRIDLEDGACAFSYQFLEKYNKHLKMSYAIWKGKEELLGMSLSLLMLTIMLSLLLLALLLRKRMALLLCPFTALFGEMLVGYVPQWRGLSLLFVSVLFVMAGEEPAGGHGRNVLRACQDVRCRQKGALIIRWLPVAALAMAAALISAAGTVFFEAPAGHLMEKNPQVREFQRGIERNAAGIASLFWDQREENIDNRSREYTGREVMRVTAAERPAGDVFLKGFCGADYADGHWTFPQDRFAEACKRAGYTQGEAAQWLLQAEYNIFANVLKNELYADSLLHIESGGLYLNDLYAAESGQRSYDASAERGVQDAHSFDGMTDYTIAYTGVRSKEAYLPYILDASKSIGSYRLNLSGDGSIRKPWGMNKIEIRAWNQKMNADAYAVVLNPNLGPYAQNGRNTALDGVDIPKLYEWYDAFVYDAYLDIPDQVHFLERIDRWLPDLYWMTENGYISNYQDVQYVYGYLAEVIKEVFGMYLDYNLNLDPVPAGIDALDYFIQESRQGYCVHFASAAVLLLRKIGIPARYASGYVARHDDFHVDGSGYTAVVRDRNAHAWVEIYVSGIGWIPVDVTPSGGQETGAPTSDAETEHAQTDTDVQTDTDTQADNDTQADEDTQTDADTQPDKNGRVESGQFGLLKWMPMILAAGGLLLLLALSLALARRAVRNYYAMPVKELQSGRYRDTVIRLNRRIYRRLSMRGKIRLHGMTDEDYKKSLASVYPNVPKQDWEKYMRAVREAAFSGQELQETDARFCYGIYDRLHRKNKISGWIYDCVYSKDK